MENYPVFHRTFLKPPSGHRITVKPAVYRTTDFGSESKSAGIILSTLRDKQQSLHLYCASGLAESMRADSEEPLSLM